MKIGIYTVSLILISATSFSPIAKAELGIEDKPPALHLSQLEVVHDLLQQAIDKLLKTKELSI